MSEFVQFALLGLGTGAIYALLAQGLVLVYRGSGLLNFAQGAIGMVAAFAFFDLRDKSDVPAVFAAIVAVALAALVSAAFYAIVIRRLRTASALARVVTTLGLFLLLVGIELEWHGGNIRLVESVLPTDPVRFGSDITVGLDRLLLVAISIAVAWGLSLFYRRTRFGLATSAVAENELAASALGWPPNFVAAVNWAAGGALAGIAVILIAPISGLHPAELSNLVIPALAVALVGNFRSFWVTLIAALALGVTQAELSRYAGDVAGDDAVVWSQTLPFLVIIIALSLRGQSLPLRGFMMERPVSVPRASGRPLPALLAFVAASLLILYGGLSANWIDAITTTMIVGLVCLSVVVVTGMTGQLSLAQYALAGVAAWTAAQLVAEAGWPHELAAAAGIAGGTGVGVLIGLSALKARGAVLAVITVAVALVLEQGIFTNQSLTGGTTGTEVGAVELFGMRFDGLLEPERYAILAVAVFVISCVAVANLRTAAAGRRLLAVRTNERAAAALGVNVAGAKLYAFGLGAAIASLAGVLAAYRAPRVLFSEYTLIESINVVILTVVGGISYVSGALTGASIAPGAVADPILAATGIENIDEWLLTFGGAVVIGIVLIQPDGLTKIQDDIKDSVLRRLMPRRFGPVREAKAQVSPALGDGGLSVVSPTTRGQRLEVGGMSVRFGGVVALDDVSVSVEPGEVIGVIGPNGAGKTTLLDGITGFVRPHSGRVLLDGRPLVGGATDRARVGLARAPQSLDLFEDLTVLDNLLIACDDHSPSTWWAALALGGRKQSLSEAGRAAVELFNLHEKLDRLPRDLSYAERRLLAVARAVAQGPATLLLDEPAAGLDVEERKALLDFIRRIADDWSIGVVLIEHDVELVLAASDRMLALDFGRVIARGTPDEIRNDPAVVRSYLGAPDTTELGDADEPAAEGVHP